MNRQELTRSLFAIEPDWQDVVDRSLRIRRRRRLQQAGATLALVAVVLVASAPALGLGDWLREMVGGTPIPTKRLTAEDIRGFASFFHHGEPIRLEHLRTSTERREALARYGLVGIRRIGRRDGLSFYVIDLRNGGHCYANGLSNQSRLFDTVNCPRGPDLFPSPVRPVVDESITGRESASGARRVFQLVGLAASGVSAVGVVGPKGAVYAKTSVNHNVFVNRHIPAVANGPLVAYNSQGVAIWCSWPSRVCSGAVQKSTQARYAIRLYLRDGASSTQIAKAIAAAKSEPGVAEVRFVSKQAALAILRQEQGPRIGRLPHNPLPNSIDIEPLSNVSTDTLAAALRALRLPGVQTISNT